jgi:hypothetical protein
LGILPYIHIVAYDRGVVRKSSLATDATITVYRAILTDTSFGIHDDGAIMINFQSRTETTGMYEETYTGS